MKDDAGNKAVVDLPRPAPTAANGAERPQEPVAPAGPAPLNRAARRRATRGGAAAPRTGTEPVKLRKRLLDKLASYLMTSNEVKTLLEAAVEASGEDMSFIEDITYIEFEIQSASVRIRNVTTEERQQLAAQAERERRA